MMNERGRQLSAGERAFFASFFQRLDDASIATVLLRNY